MRKLWHLTDEKGWHLVELWDIDATHALTVDPDHWSAENPKASELESPIMSEDQTGTDDAVQGTDDPQTGERSKSELGGESTG